MQLAVVILTSWLASQAPPPRSANPSHAPIVTPAVRLVVGPLILDVPVGWRRSWRFGTSRFDAPDGGAYLLVDTSSTLTPNLEPAECVQKLLTNLGGRPSWRPIVVDGRPAAEQVVIETSQLRDASVITARYVGCDGNVTWSMIFEGDYVRTRGAFEAVVRQIVDSIRYAEKEGPSK